MIKTLVLLRHTQTLRIISSLTTTTTRRSNSSSSSSTAEPLKTSPQGFVDLPSPFEQEKPVCILCRHKIPVDYKNTRLLSQFVSPFTGNVYDKHITGLCELQQTLVEREIRKARKAKLMPYVYKDPRYNSDPPIFNTNKPQRPNPY